MSVCMYKYACLHRLKASVQCFPQLSFTLFRQGFCLVQPRIDKLQQVFLTSLPRNLLFLSPIISSHQNFSDFQCILGFLTLIPMPVEQVFNILIHLPSYHITIKFYYLTLIMCYRQCFFKNNK